MRHTSKELAANNGEHVQMHLALADLFAEACPIWRKAQTFPAAKFRLKLLAQDAERLGAVVYVGIGHHHDTRGKFRWVWHKAIYAAEHSSDIWPAIDVLLPAMLAAAGEYQAVSPTSRPSPPLCRQLGS